MSSQRVVLHVDDDPDILSLSSDWAAVHDDVTWLTAPDAGTGLELLSTRDVDCLVSDSFRAADGEPFVTRAVDAFPDLPVVLFTSTDEAALDADVRASATGYVMKGASDPLDALFERITTTFGTGSCDVPDVMPRVGVRADGADVVDDWAILGRYEAADPDDDLATTIVTALEAYTGRDGAEFDPLYGSIDADALAALLRTPHGDLRDDVQVRFGYADHELVVTGDGLVLVRMD
ncbi:HalOD1 output domain-containing protein [Haloplanus sp. C73]|uniref:HalOD1 output domain-containing protein n=1 Tax=Haloplanus sp. C73 TaxID=3421641 RepID=UPI003EBE4092